MFRNHVNIQMGRKTSKVLGATTLFQVIILMLSSLNGAVLLPTRNVNLREAKHIAQNFMCREPQPRAYRVSCLLKGVLNDTVEPSTTPPFIVLKRCDVHSGCCYSKQKSCLPVDMYYDVVEINVHNPVTGQNSIQRIQVQQHSTCKCQGTESSEWQACTDCPACPGCNNPEVRLV